MADDLKKLLGEPDSITTKQTDLVSLLGEPDIKKKEESVVGVGESGVSPSLSSTPDREFLQDTEVIVPELPQSKETLSFQAEQKKEEVPNFMGLLTEGYQEQPVGVVKSISEGLSKAERPIEDKFASYVDRKRTELTGGVQLPNPLAAQTPEQYNQALSEYTRILRENPMAEKEDNKITAIRMLIDKTKETNQVVSDYSQRTIVGNLGTGLKKGLEDYGRGYFELFDRLKQNDAIKDLNVKLEALDRGENVSFDEGEKILAQALVDNGNKIKELEALSPSAFNIGKMAGESLGFTGEFLLTGGIGAGASKAITKGLVAKAAEGAAISRAKKMGVGLAAKMAQTGIQVGAMPTFYKGIAEDVSKGKNFGESLFENYYRTFSENFTERIFLRNPWDKTTVGAVDNFMGRLGVNMHTDKGLVGILASTAEETAEEKIGELMTAPLDYNNFDKFWNDYWNVKKNAELIGSIAVMTAPAGLVSYGVKKYDDVQLNRIGKLLPSGIRSEIDQVLDDQKLTLKEQYDLVGRIVEDHAKDRTLGDRPAEAAGNIIRYVEKKTKSNVVSAVEDRAQTPIVGTMEEVSTEDQAKVDYLESKGVKIPDGSTMATVNDLYEKEKAKEITATAETIDELPPPPEDVMIDENGRLAPYVPPTENIRVESINDISQRIQSEISRTDLFESGGEFANTLGGSGVVSVPTYHNQNGSVETVGFSNPNTGVLDVIMSGTSDHDFVGFYRIYENGVATNRWSSKMENQSRNKSNFKTMMTSIQNALPEGHEYTEKTSISTDGLRVWGQQLDRGYTTQLDENGNLITNRVAINGDAIVNELGIPVNAGNFDMINVRTQSDFAKVKAALLPYLKKFGLNETNIYWENGTATIDLPVLKKQKEEVVSVAAEQVSETAPKEEVIKPKEAISEPVEPPSPQEAPIVSPEQKEGLKQTKQESIVEPLKDVESTKKALDVVGVDPVIEFMPKETDQRKRQELENAISEGEMLIKSGKKVSGKKMTKEEIFVIQKSVDNAKKQLGIIPYSDQEVSEAYQKAKQDDSNPELVNAVEQLIQKQQPTVVEPQITEVEQLTTKQDGKETSDETQGGQKGRQEVLIEAQQKTIREVKREENKQRLASIFDDIATLTGARKEITGEERRIIRKRILDNAVEYVKTEFELVGDALREKVKSFLKENNFSDEDIVDEEIDNSIKEKGYAKSDGGSPEKRGQQAQGVVEGEEERIRVRNNAEQVGLEAQKGEGVRATASKTHKPTATQTTTKIGRFAVRVALDETKVPQAVKDAFTEREIGKYNTMSDSEAMGIAEGIAAANTYEEMKKIVFDSNVHPSVRGAVVLKLREIMTNEYDKAEKEGNKADMVFWSDQAIDFLEDFNDKVHETALTLRFLGTQAFMESFAPFQHVREYQRKVNDERDKLINSKTHKKSFETVKKESKKVRDAAIDGALNDPAVKNIINKNSDKEPTFVPKDRLKQLKEKERAAIEKLRKALRGGTLTSGGINSEALEALGELAVVYVEEAGYVVAKAVKKLIKTAKDVGIMLTEKEAQDLMPKEVDGKPIEDKIAEEATEKAAEKLASRIFGEVISSRKKEDPLLQMVNTLLGKFKERDLTKTKKESKTDIQKIAEAIANKEEYIEVWDEAKDQAISKVEENEMLTDDQKQQAIDRINKAYDNATSFTFTEAQIDRAIKKKSASLGIRIDQIVKEFYEIQTTERGRLVDALIEESGLEAEQAKLLASAIENRFDVLLAEGKKKIVDKYIGKITGDKTEAGQITTKTRKDAVSEFLELVNIGAFQSEAFREAYATAVGIPVFTQAHADKIDKLAKEIRRQKEPIMKHKATQELMGYRQIIAGFGLSDIMTTAWYGNVLGNIKTQERNFFGGWTGVAARLMAEAVVTGRPRAIFRGYVKSMREAAAKFKDVWTEGYAPFSERIDIPPSVELIRGTGLLRVLMTYWRYTRRAMDALDVWNATTGKIAFAEILANEALNVNRFKSAFNSKYRREVNQLVDKYLSVDAETVKRLKQEIEDDAAEFGYTDIDKKLILYDKIDRLRPSEVSEQAIRFGIFSTGNVQAYGTLGIISDNLAKLFRFKLPVYKNSKTGEVKYVQPLSFIAAFTKIAGNVGTMSMNFVPGVGVYRIVQGGYGKLYTDKDGKGNYFSKYSVDLTEREKKTIIGMQIAGAVSMSLLWALSDPGDDDDPLIRVTADGTGDWTKNRALSGEEWKEYSIGIKNPSGGRTWISYKYTPMIIPFSPIGFIRDSKKYRKEYKDKNTLELFGETLLQMPSALADMTALSSMNDFMSGVLKLGETAEYSKVIKSLERIVSGFYTPGLYRDVVDAVEAMYGIGIDEPMKGVPEYEAKLLKERFLGRNPISIYKRIKNGTEYTDRVDVYGRKVEKIMPYNDIIAVKPEMNEEEKMIFRHQKIMGNPSVPQVKQTFFILDNPDGTETKIFLNTSDPYQDELWHKYIILRGKSIVESMSFYQDMDEEAYTDIMNKAIENATDDARFQISYELNANPPKKIKEWQKARKE